MLIYGLDTGSVKMGYAILLVEGRDIQLMECGVIRAPTAANDNGKWSRMCVIGNDFDELLNQYGGGIGDTCAIESAFIPRAARVGVETLAESRGVVGYLASKRGLRVVTVNPSTVKKAVTGSGRADKEAVAEMVRKRFKLKTSPPPDAADAVGVALAVAQGGLT